MPAGNSPAPLPALAAPAPVPPFAPARPLSHPLPPPLPPLLPRSNMALSLAVLPLGGSVMLHLTSSAFGFGFCCRWVLSTCFLTRTVQPLHFRAYARKIAIGRLRQISNACATPMAASSALHICKPGPAPLRRWKSAFARCRYHKPSPPSKSGSAPRAKMCWSRAWPAYGVTTPGGAGPRRARCGVLDGREALRMGPRVVVGAITCYMSGARSCDMRGERSCDMRGARSCDGRGPRHHAARGL